MVFFLLVICILFLAAGCTINISIGNHADDATNETAFNPSSETTANISRYQTKARIMISTENKGNASISSSDLVVSQQLVDTYAAILQSDEIRNKIYKEYPDNEYTLALESLNQTEIFAIVVTSKNPENLKEVCDIAVTHFCEIVPQIMGNISCKVVNYAGLPQVVETN